MPGRVTDARSGNRINAFCFGDEQAVKGYGAAAATTALFDDLIPQSFLLPPVEDQYQQNRRQNHRR